MTDFMAGILTGVFVSLITQLGAALLTKPILDIRELIGEIAASLIYHANVYSQLMREERKVEAQVALRGQASMLRAKAHTLIGARVWSTVGLVPTRSELVEASTHLIALSNYVGDLAADASRQAANLEDKIRKLLHIQEG